MSELQQAISTIGQVIHFCLLLMGLRHKRFQRCLTFYLYLLVSFISSIVISYLVSEKELRRQLYYLKEFLLDMIKIGMLIELNKRIFGFFPKVQRSNRTLFGIAGMLLVVYMFALPTESKIWWGSLPFDLHSKVLQLTCFAYLMMVFSALYYRIEVARDYKFLLVGYLFSQLPVALGFAYVAIVGEAASRTVSLLNSMFFVLAMVVWTRVYWANDKDTDSPGVIGRGVDLPVSFGAPE
jgi:hypothetical protein